MSTAVTFSALAASWSAVTATCAVSASRTARWRLWRSRVVTDGILPACDIRRSVLKWTLRPGLLEARRTGISVTLAIWRMHGEVRQPGTVGPGRDEYDSGLRDCCRWAEFYFCQPLFRPARL